MADRPSTGESCFLGCVFWFLVIGACATAGLVIVTLMLSR